MLYIQDNPKKINQIMSKKDHMILMLYMNEREKKRMQNAISKNGERTTKITTKTTSGVSSIKVK
jgi:hypothetical protein